MELTCDPPPKVVASLRHCVFGLRDLFKPWAAQIAVYFRLFINDSHIFNGFTFMEDFLHIPDLSLQLIELAIIAI